MMAEKIMSNQENRIADLVRDTARTLGLSKEEAQEIIKNGGALQAQIKPILQKLATIDKRFGPPVGEFEITVPADYNHDTQVDAFAEKVKKLKTTYYYNDALTSANFAKATNKLIPGKAYLVKIFPILSQVSSEDCVSFLRRQNAIFAGAQGITLVADLKKDEFPVDKYTVSFDEKEALFVSGGDHGVPSVGRYSDGDFKFTLGYFERDWRDSRCLLCFCGFPE